MPPQKARRKKPKDNYFHISIRVERYKIRTEASIHPNANHPEFAYKLDDRDPIFKFASDLTIFGTAFAPKQRAGHIYEVTIYGDDSPSSRMHSQLKDLHIRDEKGLLQYRTHRGKSVPVYAKPPGLGLLGKERGQLQWTAYVPVLPRLASDMLVLLTTRNELYLALTELTDERARWVSRLSLQTTDPTNEE